MFDSKMSTSRMVILLVALCLCAVCISLTPADAYMPHLHQGWSMKAKVQQHDAPQTILLALNQRNLAQLETLFWKVSDPLSDLYGKFLNNEELASLIAPEQAEIDALVNWLADNNARKIEVYATKDVVEATFTLGEIEKLFGVEMFHFAHDDGRHLIRSKEQHDQILIPRQLRSIVQLVHGISDFPMKSKKSSTRHVDKKIQPNRQQSIKTASPVIVQVGARGGNPLIQVDYIPVNPKDIGNVTVDAFSSLDTVSAFYTSTAVPSCQVSSSGATICSASVKVGYYVPYTVSVQEIGSDGPGGVGTYQWPVVVTPAVVPQTITQLYSIPPTERVTNPDATQSVAEFEEQYYTPNDLVLFFQQMGLPDYSSLVSLIGPNDPTMPGLEANLDIQYIMGIGAGSPTTFWSIFQNNTFQADDILEWAYQVGNATNPPLVHSLSYGMPEDTVEPFFGNGYLARSDVEFQKLALRGMTIIIACGDTGAGDLGEAPMETSCKVLHPDWPSQSPYVTAVGTTFITPFALPICYRPQAQGGIDCQNNPLSEASVSLDAGFAWTTGGGFSNVASRPSYQSSFVDSYLQHSDSIPPSAMFNASGRAYPDFATVGHNIMVAQSGTFYGVDGTSCSAPIFGGIISLLNSLRMNAGAPQLGFVNPLFYQLATVVPDAFRDIVVGDNRCGESGFIPECCTAAFRATDGWDAVSGLGSPNYAVIASVAIDLKQLRALILSKQ
eukprot:TRINITY_DN1672_c0_g1_i1.p1 TRINITY_DN1672_c0_g1~~TRINITY_DN1672_c0_g1_i1.p1  ORF type:complete len:725 (+),score=304.26 TRINITY_DN1672_c0_g1_i1:48-2222(+)